MPPSGCMTMIRRVGMIALVGLLLLALLGSVDGSPYKRSLIRLCSKNLSDALHLTCKDRGYNEPFTYNSSEDDLASDQGDQKPESSGSGSGPGLTEECCYRQCSYAQLEQYCKPRSTTAADAVENQVWIGKNPYASARQAASSSSEERSRSDSNYVRRAVKWRIHGSKEARRKGFTSELGDDAVGGSDDRRHSVKKHRAGHVCRHQRQRRRRLDKVLERTPADRMLKNAK